MMQPERGLSTAIRERALELGFDLVGFSPAAPFEAERELILASLARGHLAGLTWITPDRVRLSCDPEALLPGARSIVALGMAYDTHPLPAHASTNPPSTSPRGAAVPGRRSPGEERRREGHPPSRPVGRVARYAWGRDYHRVIPPKLRLLSAEIVGLAGDATRCRAFVDTGPLVDRAAARRAGIGFVGKNTCVLTGRHGSYVFLSAILTTAEIEPDPPSRGDCGSCCACLDACPTGALLAPGEMDATRCISYLTIEHRGPIDRELRPRMGHWVFGCDVCQEVCPWNRARPPATTPELDPENGVGPTLDLVRLLSLDDDGFHRRFQGTPLTRAKRAGLLRNAAVALGNSHDPAAIPALVRALDDPEPLVRAHAAWALSQMDELPGPTRRAIESHLARETDDSVRAELSAGLTVIGEKDPAPPEPGMNRAKRR